jgi:PAS domain-containing protein
MLDPSVTQEALHKEIADLKQRIQNLERAEAERIRIDAEHKETELKYRTLIEYSCDVIFTDRQFDFSRANGAAAHASILAGRGIQSREKVASLLAASRQRRCFRAISGNELQD